MKHILLFFIFGILLACKTNQGKLEQRTDDYSHNADVRAFQETLNKQYSDSIKSPLKPEDLAHFKGHDFYPINEKFKVKATLELTLESKPFQMPTSTDRLPIYKKYAIAHFQIDGSEMQLSLYQLQQRPLNNRLFIPYWDLTNSEGSYGGGRYMDMDLPEGKTAYIDFNKSYNPYCAYNDKYSCPIPPRENALDFAIEAGVKAPPKHH